MPGGRGGPWEQAPGDLGAGGQTLEGSADLSPFQCS